VCGRRAPAREPPAGWHGIWPPWIVSPRGPGAPAYHLNKVFRKLGIRLDRLTARPRRTRPVT